MLDFFSMCDFHKKTKLVIFLSSGCHTSYTPQPSKRIVKAKRHRRRMIIINIVALQLQKRKIKLKANLNEKKNIPLRRPNPVNLRNQVCLISLDMCKRWRRTSYFLIPGSLRSTEFCATEAQTAMPQPVYHVLETGGWYRVKSDNQDCITDNCSD